MESDLLRTESEFRTTRVFKCDKETTNYKYLAVTRTRKIIVRRQPIVSLGYTTTFSLFITLHTVLRFSFTFLPFHLSYTYLDVFYFPSLPIYREPSLSRDEVSISPWYWGPRCLNDTHPFFTFVSPIYWLLTTTIV